MNKPDMVKAMATAQTIDATSPRGLDGYPVTNLARAYLALSAEHEALKESALNLAEKMRDGCDPDGVTWERLVISYADELARLTGGKP